MKKTTIGRTQLIIGIIILILGIVGIIYSTIYLRVNYATKDNPLNEYFQQEIGSYENASQEIKAMVILHTIDAQSEIKSDYNNLKYTLISTSIILIFLSLLFITQGKLNLYDESKWSIKN